MQQEQYLRNLLPPTDRVDAILDTDAYNEIDDQFAISYFLKKKEHIHALALLAAPFSNCRAKTPAEGMELSYQEILKLQDLMGEQVPTYRGSTDYLPDEKTAVDSEAARKLVEFSKNYSAQTPLYVVSIGAITNIASALIMDPSMAERVVIVWLGGNALHRTDSGEFNMQQDYSAARVVFGSGAPVVMFPCTGVVDVFRTSESELKYWIGGKNELCDYLIHSTVTDAESYAKGKPWTRVIWDVTAVSWLCKGGRFVKYRHEIVPMPTNEGKYIQQGDRAIQYVYHVDRDALFEDLFNTLM